jgi:hypothetical protein
MLSRLVDHLSKSVDIFAGETLTPEYAALNLR